MSLYKDSNTRREIIMDHYSKPRHKAEKLSDTVDVLSNKCVDELHLKLSVQDNIVKKALWTGIGCAIFLSSSDIFLECISGKTVEQAKDVNVNYKNMITQSGKYDSKILGKLMIYENVASHLNRLHCAEMISRAIDKAL